MLSITKNTCTTIDNENGVFKYLSTYLSTNTQERLRIKELISKNKFPIIVTVVDDYFGIVNYTIDKAL